MLIHYTAAFRFISALAYRALTHYFTQKLPPIQKQQSRMDAIHEPTVHALEV